MKYPDQTTGRYATVNGINMYYELHGSGTPLILIHGGGSTINSTFGNVLPLLAERYMVIAVEMQAHGRTSDRNTPESFVQDAADIAELLAQLRIRQADVFGFSNGGQTALQLGISHGVYVRKLIIASAFYKRSGVPDGFWSGFDNAKLSDMPQVCHDAFLAVNDDPAALLNMFQRDVERMRAFTDWTDDEIKSIKAPCLIVSGDQDVATPEHTVALYRLLPNARLAIVPGNHGSYMGEAMSSANDKAIRSFVNIVEAFLDAE